MSEAPSSDSDLEAALQRAREASPAGAGSNKATLALAGAVLLGGGFLGGYLVGGHHENQSPGGGPGNFTRRMGPMGADGRPANFTLGMIQSISGDTVTIKTDSGSTVKAKISGATNVRINKKGSIKDLTKGENIVVIGQRNGDTIDAENVNSGMMMRGRGPAGPGG